MRHKRERIGLARDQVTCRWVAAYYFAGLGGSLSTSRRSNTVATCRTDWLYTWSIVVMLPFMVDLLLDIHPGWIVVDGVESLVPSAPFTSV